MKLNSPFNLPKAAFFSRLMPTFGGFVQAAKQKFLQTELCCVTARETFFFNFPVKLQSDFPPEVR